MQFQKDLSINITGGPAPGTAITASKPTQTLTASTSGANTYVAPAAPLDNPATNLIYSLNFGVLKQVRPV